MQWLKLTAGCSSPYHMHGPMAAAKVHLSRNYDTATLVKKVNKAFEKRSLWTKHHSTPATSPRPSTLTEHWV